MSEHELDMESELAKDEDSDEYVSGDESDYEYDYGEDEDYDQIIKPKIDPEHFDFLCLTEEVAEELLDDFVDSVCEVTGVKCSVGKLLLHTNQWNIENVIEKFLNDAPKLLTDSRIKPPSSSKTDFQAIESNEMIECLVCTDLHTGVNLRHLDCGHSFCLFCWRYHFESQIKEGNSTIIECMGKDCKILVHDEFIVDILSYTNLLGKYQELALRDYILTNPNLRFCVGTDCNAVIYAKQLQGSKRVTCEQCNTTYCFSCGVEYHVPADCDVIKKWSIKCADDSETANYIRAHTKDCPKCRFCIEKNGGCNHMSCTRCKFQFCWICMEDWNSHSGDYSCSRYNKEADENVTTARESLNKYIHHFTRWDNHEKSILLEEKMMETIKRQIKKKVEEGKGNWIDYQCLLAAGSVLIKCRRTLKYTYPCAYYMQDEKARDLFEFQQAQLEQEIEDLAWKIENATAADQNRIEYQMFVAEKKREALLHKYMYVAE